MSLDVRLTDTSRDELRERIGHARERFDALVRTADPEAPVPSSTWTVREVVAHVLTVALRYCALAEGSTYPRAERPRDLDRLNDEELREVLAPLPVLADRLLEVAPVMDAFFDRLSASQTQVPFHGGAHVDAITGQTNWLGELLVHGADLARGLGVPWQVAERDHLLVVSGLQQIAPGYLQRERARGRDWVVELRVAAARPWVLHIHDGLLESRVGHPHRPPDAVVRTSAATLCAMLYQRIGTLQAVGRGMRVVGGRRPWVALQLQALFEAP